MSHLLKNLSFVIASAASDWGGAHPLIVHFPIVLFLIAPLFILAGLIFTKNTRVLFACALVVMLAGVASTFLATSSGELASEALEANPAYLSTLEEHMILAERARLIFCVLGGIFLLYVVAPSSIAKNWGQTIKNRLFILLFLAGYLFGLLVLVNAAHYGGKLVHKHGITSTLYSK